MINTSSRIIISTAYHDYNLCELLVVNLERLCGWTLVFNW